AVKSHRIQIVLQWRQLARRAIHFALSEIMSSPSRKVFVFRFSEIYGCLRASRPGKRALRPIVTKRGAGCDGRGWHARRSVSPADGEIVWSRSPDAGIKFLDDDSRTTVANKPGTPVGTPGRARISRKTTRAGNAGSFRRTCGDLLACFSLLHARLRVRLSARHSLRPLTIEGR